MNLASRTGDGLPSGAVTVHRTLQLFLQLAYIVSPDVEILGVAAWSGAALAALFFASALELRNHSTMNRAIMAVTKSA